jgi:transcriptional regulator with XRE-family HTH domain
MKTFADRLKACGVGEAITLAELARQAGVKPPSVCDWLSGKTKAENLKAAPLLRAALFLQVNPSWLLMGKGSRDPFAPTVLVAREPDPNDAPWPFERVSPAKYYALPAHLRIGVQMLIDGVMLSASFPSAGNTGTHG